MGEACTDCEACGADLPGGLRLTVDGLVPARRGGRRHRRRGCDICGHPIRYHALDVAPPPTAVTEARLPDDLPDDGTAGLGWSEPLEG
jgi:hypothetical protein